MSNLFRPEVLEHRANRLHGEVSLALPIRWQLLSLLLAFIVMVAAIFLAFASYSRVEVVKGSIMPDKGIITISPARPGVISELFVTEGQTVSLGANLVNVTSGEILTSGQAPSVRLAGSLQIQDKILARQSAEMLKAAEAERARAMAQISGLTEELKSVDDQISIQRAVINTANDELEQVKRVAARGFVSRRDMLLREERLATQRQQLSQLEQLRANKTSQIRELNGSIKQTSAEAIGGVAALEGNREQLRQLDIDAQARGTLSMLATADGVVTSIAAKVGQNVTTNTALMAIIPSGSKLRAELTIPATMIGFVKKGQLVNLGIDAFPYQQFGSVKARIISVSGSPRFSSEEKNDTRASYIAVADLSRSYINAYGNRQPFVPGMTFTARIIVRKQSLLRWLLDPVYAVSHR